MPSNFSTYLEPSPNHFIVWYLFKGYSIFLNRQISPGVFSRKTFSSGILPRNDFNLVNTKIRQSKARTCLPLQSDLSGSLSEFIITIKFKAFKNAWSDAFKELNITRLGKVTEGKKTGFTFSFGDWMWAESNFRAPRGQTCYPQVLGQSVDSPVTLKLWFRSQGREYARIPRVSSVLLNATDQEILVALLCQVAFTWVCCVCHSRSVHLHPYFWVQSIKAFLKCHKDVFT